MKVPASTILSALGILKTIDTTDMKLSTSYKVKKVLNACQEAISDFDKKRVALAEKHGTLNKDKTQYLFEKEGSQEAFQAEIQEMLDDEIDVDIPKIPLELVEDYITIAPVSVELVSWFIDGLEDV
jgi:hypothetical protein